MNNWQRVAPRRATGPSAHGQDAGVTPEMRVDSEESCLSVISVDGPDEAVRAANDTEYGPAAAVFSENVRQDASRAVNRGGLPRSARSRGNGAVTPEGIQCPSEREP